MSFNRKRKLTLALVKDKPISVRDDFPEHLLSGHYNLSVSLVFLQQAAINQCPEISRLIMYSLRVSFAKLHNNPAVMAEWANESIQIQVGLLRRSQV